MLSIKLDYKIPTFVAVLAMGRLPARNVEVTASAWRQDAQFRPAPGRFIFPVLKRASETSRD